MKTQSQKYVEIINKLEDDELHRLTELLFPVEIQKLLLHAPLKLKKQIIDDFLNIEKKGRPKMKRALKNKTQ
jgi:N-acetylglutamate synthase-like GNAT family acetyltransferase